MKAIPKRRENCLPVKAKADSEPITWLEEYCTTEACAILPRGRRYKIEKAVSPLCTREGRVP